MSNCGVEISSVNFSGQQTNVVFMPDTGGTITLGVKTFPFTYYSEYLFGTFYCYLPSCKYTYTVVIPGPTPTPTVTPTNTPTPLPTPTPTPALVYSDNLWTDSVWNNACDEAGYGPSNVTIYSFKPWGTLVAGDFVYGNPLCTIPPVGSATIITDGNIWIQINLVNGQIINTGICP
jgi:hypothetical protein